MPGSELRPEISECVQGLRTLFPLRSSKTARTPNLSKIYPAIVFGGSCQGDWNLTIAGTNFGQIWRSGRFELRKGKKNPVLLFLGLFENTKETLQNTKDFSHRANPQKPFKTSRQHSKRPKEFHRKKSTKETQTPWKRRTGRVRNLWTSICFIRRRTNLQQLTCNIDLSCSLHYLFFAFLLIELKPFVLKEKALGEKF